MDLRETLHVALEALLANKMRSFLTMLGIVIGIAAVIAMVALGQGARNSVNARIAALGTTLISVNPGQMRGPGGVAASADRAKLVLDDAAAVEAGAIAITAVEPEMQRSMQVQYESANTNTSVIGTTSNYLDVRRYALAAGRMFSSGDDGARKRYVVVGSQVLADLGLTSPDALVGEAVRIGSVQFEVVGVLKPKGQGMGFGDPDDQVLIPIQTARYRLFGTDNLRALNVLARSEADISLAMAEVKRILRREHRIAAGREDDFSIRNQADFLNTMNETTQVFTLLLAGIALVSLVVGGIGIMNIMLVSVTERTREIGVRMAIGATRANILSQFLIEALVLCLVGGLIGVTLGTGVALALKFAFQWNTQVGATSVLIAIGFAFAVGIGFGVWPARRAAALDPIEALRYE